MIDIPSTFSYRLARKLYPSYQKEICTMANKSGMTLMEVMLVIAIIAIVSGIAIPNFIGWFPKYKLGVAARELVSTLQQARIRAIKESTDVAVIVDVANDNYQSFRDDGAGTPANARNATLDAGERTYITPQLPAGVTISSATLVPIRLNRRGIPFDAAGNPATGTVTFTNSLGLTRTVTLLITGNARIP